MKRIVLLPFVSLFLLSCTPSSHYSALFLITSNTSEKGYMKFDEFNGQYVFKLKLKKGESDIKYQASLKEGEIKVTYMFLNEEYPLFTIKGGQTLSSKGGYIESGTVPIILRSESKVSGGEFTFTL